MWSVRKGYTSMYFCGRKKKQRYQPQEKRQPESYQTQGVENDKGWASQSDNQEIDNEEESTAGSWHQVFSSLQSEEAHQ